MSDRGDGLTLLSNASATSADFQWRGGPGMISIEGTWAGATATLQFISKNGTAIAVGANTTFTANGAAGFTLARCLIRVTITGGPPSAIYAYAWQM